MLKISVICPTYGRVNELNEAIYSFLLQDYPHKEMIVLNDFAKQKLFFDHPNVKIYNFGNRISSLGIKKNLLAKRASGDIIIPLDDDDVLLPNYFETMLSHWNDRISWILQTRLLVYNQMINKIQLSGGGPLNGFTYKKDVLTHSKYPKQNFNINKSFIKQCQKRYRGKLLALPINEIGYISRYNPEQKNNYHIRFIGQKFQHNIDRFAEVDRHLDNKILNREIPTGDVKLNPYWQKNYIDMTADFIKNFKD